MKKNLGLALIISCIIHNTSNGQILNQSIKIGDEVPEITFKFFDQSDSTKKLSQFRGKLVILDFWATWCGACVAGLQKLDTLQTIFGDKIQIILVNSSNRKRADSKEKLDSFYARKKRKYPEFRLPFAYDDTVAYSIFKHTGIPHYAWISPEGKVVAITSAKHVTAANIQKILSGFTPSLPEKNDSLRRSKRSLQTIL